MTKYNTEGYHDPTVYEAFSNIEGEQRRAAFRPLVYICSPYAGDIPANTDRARKFSAFAADHGVIPVTPHLLYPQFIQDRDLGLFFGIVLLTKCAELWVFGGEVTPGMKREINKAEFRGMTVRYFNEDCEEVSKYGS